MSGALSEDGKKLIDEARRIHTREVAAALQEGDHNLAVRRSQEAVELALKGTLRCLGVDYPRVHDVGTIFTQQVLKKTSFADTAALARIQEISLWLTQARAPAFYQETDYGANDAERASTDAAHVLGWVREIIQPSPSNSEVQ